jgi:hypothetical protein
MDDTFNPAALTRSDTITSTTSANKPAPTSVAKPSKASQTFSRIDYEPLYADLKAHVGDNWAVYHDALTRFTRGKNPAEDERCVTNMNFRRIVAQ